jgi:hypothetical protein
MRPIPRMPPGAPPLQRPQMAQHRAGIPTSTSRTEQSATSAVPLLLDVGVPLGSYYQLHAGLGMNVMVSLTVSSAVPAARVVARLLSKRRLNVLAGLMLAMSIAGMGASFASSDLLIIAAKGSAVSGVSAIAMLLSAGLGRPLTSELLKPCMTSGSAAKTATWDRLSASCPPGSGIWRCGSASSGALPSWRTAMRA